MPPVPQALVRTIPESGHKSLYLASHAGRVFGMPESDGRALIDELIAHATQRQFVYTHRWRVHDLVIGTIAAPCTAALSSTTCAGNATCSVPRCLTSPIPVSRRESPSQPPRRKRHNVRVGHLADMSVALPNVCLRK